MRFMQCKKKLLPYKDAVFNIAKANIPFRKKKHILMQEGDGFIQELLTPVISGMGVLLL